MGESKMRGEQVSRRACKHEGVHACVRECAGLGGTEAGRYRFGRSGRGADILAMSELKWPGRYSTLLISASQIDQWLGGTYRFGRWWWAGSAAPEILLTKGVQRRAG